MQRLGGGMRVGSVRVSAQLHKGSTGFGSRSTSRLVKPGDDAFKQMEQSSSGLTEGPPRGGDAIEGDGSVLEQSGFAQFSPLSKSEEGGYPDEEDPVQAVYDTRTGARKWHEAPKHLRELKRRGYTPSMIEEHTGMHPREQSEIEVQASVFHSIEDELQSHDHIKFFEGNGRSLLPHLRTLDKHRRIAAAEHLADTGGSEDAAIEIVKSYKQFDLFPSDATGFADSPGDAVAFKLFRLAREEKRKVDEANKHLDRALKVVDSFSAKERLLGLREEIQQAAAGGDTGAPSAARDADVEIVRLGADEVGFRPMPVLGTVDSLRPSDIASVGRTTRAGAFNSFRASSWKGEWVALPEWPVLSFIDRPFALHIARAEELVDSVPRLAENRGPALAVLDPDSTSSTESYQLGGGSQQNPLFLARKQSAVAGVERVDIVSWSQSMRDGGWEHLARLVVFIRPPAPAGVGLHRCV